MTTLSELPLHSVAVEMHQGMFSLAAFMVFGRLVGSLYLWFVTSDTGKFPQWIKRAIAITDPAVLVASLGGLIFLGISVLTGFVMEDWPVDQLLDNTLVQNKMILTAIIAPAWGAFVAMRLLHGPKLWEDRFATAVATGLVGVGWFGAALIGCISGILTEGRSIFDPIWEALGVDLRQPLALQLPLALSLLALGVAGFILGSYLRLRPRRVAAKPG